MIANNKGHKRVGLLNMKLFHPMDKTKLNPKRIERKPLKPNRMDDNKDHARGGLLNLFHPMAKQKPHVHRPLSPVKPKTADKAHVRVGLLNMQLFKPMKPGAARLTDRMQRKTPEKIKRNRDKPHRPMDDNTGHSRVGLIKLLKPMKPDANRKPKAMPPRKNKGHVGLLNIQLFHPRLKNKPNLPRKTDMNKKRSPMPFRRNPLRMNENKGDSKIRLPKRVLHIPNTRPSKDHNRLQINKKRLPHAHISAKQSPVKTINKVVKTVVETTSPTSPINRIVKANVERSRLGLRNHPPVLDKNHNEIEPNPNRSRLRSRKNVQLETSRGKIKLKVRSKPHLSYKAAQEASKAVHKIALNNAKNQLESAVEPEPLHVNVNFKPVVQIRNTPNHVVLTGTKKNSRIDLSNRNANNHPIETGKARLVGNKVYLAPLQNQITPPNTHQKTIHLAHSTQHIQFKIPKKTRKANQKNVVKVIIGKSKNSIVKTNIAKAIIDNGFKPKAPPGTQFRLRKPNIQPIRGAKPLSLSESKSASKPEIKENIKNVNVLTINQKLKRKSDSSTIKLHLNSQGKLTNSVNHHISVHIHGNTNLQSKLNNQKGKPTLHFPASMQKNNNITEIFTSRLEQKHLKFKTKRPEKKDALRLVVLAKQILGHYLSKALPEKTASTSSRTPAYIDMKNLIAKLEHPTETSESLDGVSATRLISLAKNVMGRSLSTILTDKSETQYSRTPLHIKLRFAQSVPKLKNPSDLIALAKIILGRYRSAAQSSRVPSASPKHMRNVDHGTNILASTERDIFLRHFLPQNYHLNIKL